MRIIKLLLPALLLFSAAASAGEQDNCRTDSQCIVVEHACPNGWRAINSDFKAEYNKWLEKTRKVVRCFAGPLPGIKAPTKAMCSQDKCIVIPPEKQSGNEQEQPEDEISASNFFSCDRDEECIIAEGVCSNTWLAINRRLKKHYEEILRNTRPLAECTPGDELAIPPEDAFCHENKCAVY